jgi:hypothetical protein
LTSATPGARSAFGWLLAAASWGLSSGCALFTDLNGDPYRLVEAGVCEGGPGDADGGCTLPGIVCSPACTSEQVCCLTPSPTSLVNLMCVAPSECASQGSTSFQLCTPSASDCPQNGSCIAQICKSNGITVREFACTMITGCTTP